MTRGGAEAVGAATSRSPSSPSRAPSWASPCVLSVIGSLSIRPSRSLYLAAGPARCASPGRRPVVLQEHPVDVVAGLAADDRVVDAGGAVDQVERGVEALLGDADLGGVGALVG